MTDERISVTPTSEEHWLGMRALDITSTESPALFGEGAYISEYELFHLKAGTLTKNFEDNERTKWGRRLEPVIAAGLAEDFGLIVKPFKDYMRVPSIRMGSSFDYLIVGLTDGFVGDETYRDVFRQHGVGLMEVKNVDGLVFKRKWLNDDQVEAPLQIEIQMQHEMEVAGIEWCMCAPLIGGNQPRPFYRLRDQEFGTEIRDRVAAMWSRIAAGDAPVPDYARDAKIIRQIHLNNDGSTIDLRDNPRAQELVVAYHLASQNEKAAKERKAASQAELLTIIDSAKTAILNGFKVTAGTTSGGHREGGMRSEYRFTKILAPLDFKVIDGMIPAAEVAPHDVEPFRNFRVTPAAGGKS